MRKNNNNNSSSNQYIAMEIIIKCWKRLWKTITYITMYT